MRKCLIFEAETMVDVVLVVCNDGVTVIAVVTLALRLEHRLTKIETDVT